MDHSIVSRSPSGQWYPQQQPQPMLNFLPQGYSNPNLNMTNPALQQQWSLASASPGSPMPTPANLGGSNSGVFNNPNPGNMQPNLWYHNMAAGGGGGAAGNMTGGGVAPNPDTLPRLPSNFSSLPPQQQQQYLMMQQAGGVYAPQDQCCATCCGPQQSQCCGPQSQCCGPPSQSCCGGPTGGGCCPVPGEPVDPFCCTPALPGQEPPCYVRMYNCFDWTFLFACLFFVLTVIGFAVVVATKSADDIFTTFKVTTAAQLDVAMGPYIPWMNDNSSDISSSSSSITSSQDSSSESSTGTTSTVTTAVAAAANAVMSLVSAAPVSAATTAASTAPSATVTVCSHTVTHSCTKRRLLGSFGTLCMEDNMYANTFAVQLSSWTNARDTLWFLAMIYSGFTLLYAILINAQRHPTSNAQEQMMNAGHTMPSISAQEQEEFLKMTPPQQQAFIQEYQQRVAAVQRPSSNASFTQQPLQQPLQQPGAGCCGSDSGIEVFDTPFYEFVRVAWFVSGLTAFVWTCNLFVSFWAFSDFYIAQTTGPLKAFWTQYARKMNGSLVMVTIFLAWPLCNAALDLCLWLLGFLPWVVIRATCKQGLRQYRPSLPLSQLPAYIRADMFFMDFQDVKRLGFSRQAWIMLTGSEKPFFGCCEDPTVDKDPTMTQLLQQRLQWQQNMMAMLPPWMQQQAATSGMMLMMGPNGPMMVPNSTPGTPPANANLNSPGHPATIPMNGDAAVASAAAGGGATGHHHTHGSHGRAAAPQAPAEYPVEDGEMKTHRRRRRSSTHEHQHRHADPSAAAAIGYHTPVAAGGMEQTSSGLPGANNKEGNSTRHRRRRSSHSKGAFDAASSAAAAADGAAVTPATGESGHRRRRRSHSRSRSRSMEASAQAAAAAAGGGASPVPGMPASLLPAPVATPLGGEEGGAHRRRRHSHSRSRSRSKVAMEAASAAGGTAGQASTPGKETQHRRRRHSRSKSQEKTSGVKGGAAAAAADLNALMQL